ncbi:hypothetical protein Ancab_010390 [Ancistrocladus abbreviatus]
MARTISNKQIVLKDYVTGFPKATDMELKVTEMHLMLPRGFDGNIVKNLFLSCDPYLRGHMSKPSDRPTFVAFYKPGLPISGYGVSRVLESGNPNFKKGDFVWGEYLVPVDPLKSHFKIQSVVAASAPFSDF